MENRRDDAVEVVFDGGAGFRVPPCSLRVEYRTLFVVEGLSAEVSDPSGDPVHGAVVRLMDSGPQPWTVKVGIPAEGSETCPTPVVDAYRLTVTNHMWTEVEVWRGSERIGVVAGVSSETLGPLPGDWHDAQKIVLRASDGRESLVRYWGVSVESNLGEAPEVMVAVRQGGWP